MQDRLLTEYEWRMKKKRKPHSKPGWYGAQCLFPSSAQRLKEDRSFHLFLLMVAVATALGLPHFFPEEPVTAMSIVETGAEPSVQVRSVNAVTYEWPSGFPSQQVTFTRNQLLHGKMLLADRDHPLPSDLPPPNTASIALYGKGMVPVRSLSLKTGRETIDALCALFSRLRALNTTGLYVCQGSTTPEEQRASQLLHLRTAMMDSLPEEAVQRTRNAFESPGTGSLLQEYAIEFRFASSPLPTEKRPLESFPEGQTLLQQCWRFGFVRAETPFRFRYVGKAHAAAITYLDLSFADYLHWLHQKGTLLISSGGQPQYLILCQPLTGDHIAFDLPPDTSWEASLDNMGYALVACTF